MFRTAAAAPVGTKNERPPQLRVPPSTRTASAERVQVRVVGVAEGWDARPKWMSKEFAATTTTTTTTTDPRVRLEIVVSVTDFD